MIGLIYPSRHKAQTTNSKVDLRHFAESIVFSRQLFMIHSPVLLNSGQEVIHAVRSLTTRRSCTLHVVPCPRAGMVLVGYNVNPMPSIDIPALLAEHCC